MSYELDIPDSFKRTLRKHNKDMHRRVKKTIKKLLDDPTRGKPLKGPLAGIRSERVGGFRIKYKIKGNVVKLISLDPRGGAYRRG